jgi:hypothetical protein
MCVVLQNPQLMQNPMGAFFISSMLGVDVHKIAGPMAMLGGGGSFASWAPMLMSDPGMSNLLMSNMMGGGAAAGGGLFGGMGGMGGLMGGLGGMAPLLLLGA